MAHEVEKMFFVGETPWHGLGTMVNDDVNIKDAIKHAGLDWSVGLKPVYCKVDKGIVDVNGNTVMSDHTAPAKAVIRESDNTVLGVVGERYTPLQNSDAFDFFQPFVDAGEVTLETAGSLQAGKKIWVLARIKGDDIDIKNGDTVRQFIMLSNSHDGTTSVRAGYTPIRVVCANTLALAHRNDGSTLIRLKHTASVKTNLDAVRQTMNLARKTFEANAEQYRLLANKDINQADVLSFVQKVFDIEGVKFEDLSSRQKNQIDLVLNLAETGKGQELHKGMTLWKLYNAYTEYLTHEVTDNADRRYSSLWFGGNKIKNDKALSIALLMAA